MSFSVDVSISFPFTSKLPANQVRNNMMRHKCHDIRTYGQKFHSPLNVTIIMSLLRLSFFSKLQSDWRVGFVGCSIVKYPLFNLSMMLVVLVFVSYYLTYTMFLPPERGHYSCLALAWALWRKKFHMPLTPFFPFMHFLFYSLSLEIKRKRLRTARKSFPF